MPSATVRNSHRQAIVTRYVGPSNVRGARVIASCEGGRIILSWDHALNSDQNHEQACRQLADKLGWGGDWIGGGTKDGYVFADASA